MKLQITFLVAALFSVSHIGFADDNVARAKFNEAKTTYADRATPARLEAAIASHPGVDGVPLSIAIGHASCPPAASVHEAQHEADSQMYAYKRQAEMAQRVG